MGPHTNSRMCSPYRNLHDSYVSNRWSYRQLMSLALLAGCVVVLAVLVSIPVLEKKSANEEASHSEAVLMNLDHFESEGSGSGDRRSEQDSNVCDDVSSWLLSESIPLDMKYEANATFGVPLYEAWTDLLNTASQRVDVASFYWSLTGEDIGVNTSTDLLGKHIFKQFQELPSRNVSVRIASSIPSLAWNSTDLQILRKKGLQIKRVNFGHLTHGVLHTKFWIVDMKHVYIGSANMDWRSLTQVKELGVVIYNCSCLAKDLHKIFDSYWVLGHRNATIPDPWPDTFNTSVNKDNPMLVNISGGAASIYIAGSPPSFCASGRTTDLDAILSAIEGADRFIDVAMMEYFPTSRYLRPYQYWPLIDNALRKSALERHVRIRLLISSWESSDPAMLLYLKSLSALNGPPSIMSIEVKLFIVPVGNHSDIPYTRLNHNKYMVTDKVAYIGTSNWSADYFTSTAGVGLVISQEHQKSNPRRQTFKEQLESVFERDWSSTFAINLADFGTDPHTSQDTQ